MRSRHFGSYNAALIRPYYFPAVVFSAGNATQKIPVPKLRSVGVTGTGGLAGKVLSVELQRVTVSFAGTTSDAAVQVGDGTTATKYFNTGLVIDESLTATNVREFEDSGSAVDIESGRTTVTVTFIAPVGTPGGTADVTVVIAWY
jgi:hypothetical protein